MLILVINCGSSSAKYELFNLEKNRSLVPRLRSVPMVSKVEPLAKGIVERIGHASSSCKDHYAAVKIIVSALTDEQHGVIKSKDEIAGIGHRVVHGGSEFKESILITRKVIGKIEKYRELAPLHNPPSLSGIKACSKILKGIPQVAVFDTSFHQTMPARSFLYGIPIKFYKRYGIRRYGFHGTSHRFVAEEAAKRIGRSLNRLKLITCHLGNGCSMTAVDKARSIDTTMGFTPLEGLLMGTRSGDLDPAVPLYLLEKEKASPNRMNDILNRESGLLGISGISNDMRDLVKSSKLNPSTLRQTQCRPEQSRGTTSLRIDGERSRTIKAQSSKRARLAIEMFIYRIEKYIGAYQAAMGGLDAVIFTAGISENHPWLIRRIARDLKNVVSRDTKFLVIPTNEELLIARDTYEIIRRRDAAS